MRSAHAPAVRGIPKLVGALRSPVVRLMTAYVAVCALWVGLFQPLLDPNGLSIAETAGLVCFLGTTGFLLYRACTAQTLALGEAQAARLEAEQHLRAFVDHSPTRITFKDAENRFLVVNRGFTDWFGLDMSHVAGLTPRDVFSPDLARSYEEMDAEVISSGRPKEFQITHYRNGESRTSTIVKFPVRGPDGTYRGMGSIASDSTEKLEAEAALRHAMETADAANRAKSQFLAAMSHELRTPLNAIIGFSELLAKPVDPRRGAPVEEYATAINDSGRHLLGVINDILDISKVEAGKLTLNEEALSIDDVFASAMQVMTGRAEQEGVALMTSVPEDCPRLWADEQRIRQILLNLISNAIKFTPRDGEVEVSADTRDGLVLRVRDTGIGMSEEDIPKALSLFGQVDNQLSRTFEGTGLGLPLTKALAELHGGTLELTSELGKGTTVTISFPADRVMPDADQAAA